MPNTFFGLTIGSSGLNAANIALNTTSHNISNIETEGYSRQRINATAGDALRTYSSYGMQGSGVAVNSVKQIRDSYYDYKYWNNNRITGEYEIKHHYTMQIEDLYYNEMTDSGFISYYKNFTNALDGMSSTPSLVEYRNKVIEAGQTLADYFNNIAENLESNQDETNTQIKMILDRVNTISENIASLNGQISVLEMNGEFANDLRDKRNTLVDELSTLVGVNVKETESPTGSVYYDIKIGNQTLVYGTKYNTLHVESKDPSDRRHDTDMEGLYDIVWSNGQIFDTYNSTLSGQLMGYIQIRDGDNLDSEVNGQPVDYKGIPFYMKETNAFLAEYTRQFNEIHMSGEDGYGNSSAEVPFFTIKDVTVDEMKDRIKNQEATYEKYITHVTKADDITKQVIAAYRRENKLDTDTDDQIKTKIEAELKKGATIDIITTENLVDCIADHVTAKNICVNPELIEDNKKMCAGTTIKDGIETPDVVNPLAALQNSKTFRGGRPEDWMQSIISVSTIDAQSAKNMYMNHENIGEAIVNQRLSVMGVDKEEEAVALVKYQHAYELASKVISVMNEIYDRLINQTGV